jgi:glycosyltransferase involved in cell wall biosynthesis
MSADLKINNKKIKISFVIPAYNEEKFIFDCINSVIQQIKKYKISYEIIVVNNNSTDKTREIASKFKEVKLVDEYRQGLTFARQAGFLNSSGELIANIDADTRLTDNWIGVVLEEFEKNKNLIALSGPQIYYDIPKKILIQEKIFYFLAYVTYLINKYILNISSMIQGGNFVVKRSALEQIGGFNTQILFWGEDTDIAKRLHKIGNVKFTFKLPIYASGRRLLREGKFKTAWRYVLNYFSIIFFDKPFHKEINIYSQGNFKKILKLDKFYLEFEENKTKLILVFMLILLLFAGYLIFNINFLNYKDFLKAEVKNIILKIK